MAATIEEYDADHIQSANALKSQATAIREAVLRGYNSIKAIYDSRDADRIWAVEKLFAGNAAMQIVQTRIDEIFAAPRAWEGNVVDLHLVSALTKLNIVMVNMYTHSDQFQAADALLQPRSYPCHTEARFTPLGFMRRPVEIYKLPNHFEAIIPVSGRGTRIRLNTLPTVAQMLANLETHIALLARHRTAWLTAGNAATLAELQGKETLQSDVHSVDSHDFVDLLSESKETPRAGPPEALIDMANTQSSDGDTGATPARRHKASGKNKRGGKAPGASNSETNSGPSSTQDSSVNSESKPATSSRRSLRTPRPSKK
jgi:exonuclease III